MPSNPNNTTPVLTPGGNLAPSQQTNPPGAVPYIENGLTYQSNNPDFVERDDNGNIIVNQGATDNQNLVLEATSLRYVNASVIRNIDTRFKYFRFPAENVAVPDISFEGFGVDDIIDPITARYVPSANYTIQNDQFSTGILMDIVQQGLPQVFTNQYYISDVIKESGVNLRMQGRIRHRYVNTGNTNTNNSVIRFFILKRNGSTQFVNREFIEISPNVAVDAGTIRETYFDVTIPNSDFESTDSFQIAARVNVYNAGVADHVILREFTTWSTTDATQNIELFGGFIGSIQVDNNTFATGTTPPNSNNTSSTPTAGTTGGTPPSNPGGGNQGGQVGN